MVVDEFGYLVVMFDVDSNQIFDKRFCSSMSDVRMACLDTINYLNGDEHIKVYVIQLKEV